MLLKVCENSSHGQLLCNEQELFSDNIGFEQELFSDNIGFEQEL